MTILGDADLDTGINARHKYATLVKVERGGGGIADEVEDTDAGTDADKG